MTRQRQRDDGLVKSRTAGAATNDLMRYLATFEHTLAVTESGVDILTLGQYLRPTGSHLPVARYYTPSGRSIQRDYGSTALEDYGAVHRWGDWTREELYGAARVLSALLADFVTRRMTSELDAARLPPRYVVALYWQRWRIEDAYNIVKRLLGLAYFWCGAQNAVEMQIWATWLSTATSRCVSSTR